MLPFITMVFVQLGFAGKNILSKLALDSGMNPLIHVAYRQMFGSIIISPFAYFLERGRRPRMTLPIFIQIFFSSVIGLERVGIRSKAGQAKLIGTTLCVGGAMLLSFFRGSRIPIGTSQIHWEYADSVGIQNDRNGHGNIILGPFLLIISAVSWAVWFIIQARMSESYPAPYSSSALMLIMASFQCVIVGVSVDHKVSSWSLYPSIRAISSIYAGAVCSALAFCLMSWCIERRGPLYVSVFSPLLLVIVAVLSWGLLREKLHLGNVAGSVLIVTGLYGVLWGKNKENVREEDRAREGEGEGEAGAGAGAGAAHL